jgi:hypothetical protein
MPMKTNVQQRKPLNGFHQRKPKNVHRTHVTPNGHLPDADALKAIGAPDDLVARVQTWRGLKDAERDHARQAAAGHLAAETATADYRRKVRETIATGGDPDKVKDTTEKHKAVAKAHAQFSADARAERERLGYDLGVALEAGAPDLFTAAEAEIDKAGAVLTEALAGIRATWADYSAAFELRRWLSAVALNGGRVGAYHGASVPPAAVSDAIDALDDALGDVDRLKSDEAEVLAFRAANG